MTHGEKFGLGLSGLAALLLYFLNKKGLLHESVTSSIITGDGTTLQDPVTGAPQLDSNTASTLPNGYSQAVAPIDSNGQITNYPSDPVHCSCPSGTTLWKDAANGRYLCIPS